MRRLGTFLLLTSIFSAPFWYLSREFGSLYTTLLMWSPAAAAFVTTRLFPLEGQDLGLKRFDWRSTGGAYLITVLVISIVFLIIYAAGLASFPNTAEWRKAAEKTGLVGWSALTFGIASYLLTATAGIVALTAAALGEEIGWRGFLAPELDRKYGFVIAAIGSGLIWSAWHMPLFVGKISPLELLLFAVTLTGFSVFMCWVRLRSMSVWPAAFTHGAYNALLSFFMRFSVPTRPQDAIWLDDSGYAMAIAGLLIGAVFIGLRNQSRPLEIAKRCDRS